MAKVVFGIQQQINMAQYWTVTQGTTNVTSNTIVGDDVVVNLTIQNNPDGNYILVAENFKIQLANQTGSTNEWVGGNVDEFVEKVTFSTNSDNTVNAAVKLKQEALFQEDTTLFVDIDQIDVPLQDNNRQACIKTSWAFDVGDTDPSNADALYGWEVHDVDGGNIVETELNAGSASVPVFFKHSGSVADGEQSLIADITFTRLNNAFFSGNEDSETAPYVIWTMVNQTGYGQNYVEEFTYTTGNLSDTDTTQVITSFNVKIKYTPPEEIDYNDEASFCSLQHMAIIKFDIQTPASGIIENQIKSLDVTEEIGSKATNVVATVRGSKNTEYQLSVIKTLGPDNSTPAAKPFYNSYDHVFTAYNNPRTYNTGSSGVVKHVISIPASSSDQRYDIKVLPSGATTVLPSALSGVSLTQFSDHIASVHISDGHTPSNFGTITDTSFTIRKPRISKEATSNYSSTQVIKATNVGAVSVSSKIVVDDASRLSPGMFVFSPFTQFDAGGSHGIPHNTKIKSIRGNNIVLTNTIRESADQEVLSFVSNTANIVPFNLSIPKKFVQQVTSGTTSSKNYVDLVSSTGIVNGMTVFGTGISGTVKVTDATGGGVSNRVTINSLQSLSGGVTLTFAFTYSTTAANVSASSTAISGIDTQLSRITNAVTNSKTLVIATSDTVRGIRVGMVVGGDENIPRDTKVSSIDYASKTLTLDTDITIPANSFLSFEAVDNDGDYSNTGYIGDVNLLHCQLDPKDGELTSAMELSGYLLVNELVSSERAILHLDDLVTVTNS